MGRFEHLRSSFRGISYQPFKPPCHPANPPPHPLGIHREGRVMLGLPCNVGDSQRGKWREKTSLPGLAMPQCKHCFFFFLSLLKDRYALYLIDGVLFGSENSTKGWDLCCPSLIKKYMQWWLEPNSMIFSWKIGKENEGAFYFSILINDVCLAYLSKDADST